MMRCATTTAIALYRTPQQSHVLPTRFWVPLITQLSYEWLQVAADSGPSSTEGEEALASSAAPSEYDDIFASLHEPAVMATTTALKTLQKSPFSTLQSRESRAVLNGVMSRAMGPAAVRQAARLSLTAQGRTGAIGTDSMRPIERDMAKLDAIPLDELKNQHRANLAGLDDAIKVVDKDDRYGQRMRRRKRAQEAMDRDFIQHKRKGNKLVLTQEQKVAAQLAAIAKTLSVAMENGRSLYGQRLSDAASTIATASSFASTLMSFCICDWGSFTIHASRLRRRR